MIDGCIIFFYASAIFSITLNYVLDEVGTRLLAKKRAEKGCVAKSELDLNYFAKKVSISDCFTPGYNLLEVILKTMELIFLQKGDLHQNFNEEFFSLKDVKWMTQEEQNEYKNNPNWNTIKRITKESIKVAKDAKDTSKEEIKSSSIKQESNAKKEVKFETNLEEDEQNQFIKITASYGGGGVKTLLKIRFSKTMPKDKLVNEVKKIQKKLFNKKNMNWTNTILFSLILFLDIKADDALTVTYEKLAKLKFTANETHEQVFIMLNEISEECKEGKPQQYEKEEKAGLLLKQK